MGKFSRLGNDLYSGRRSVDFVGRTRLWYAISGLIIVAAVLALTIVSGVVGCGGGSSSSGTKAK